MLRIMPVKSGARKEMSRRTILRNLTRQLLGMAALAVAVIAAASTLAVAQDGYRWNGRGDYAFDRARFDVARDFGYEDGSRVAHEDIAKAKPYDPYPRGKYAHEDRGYRREYGDKYAYEEAYAHAYQEGYQRAFRRW
jgi:hypothetical protein